MIAAPAKHRFPVVSGTQLPIYFEVLYGAQDDLYDRLKNDSYVIENDLYVRI
jgi:hypothetical protein